MASEPAEAAAADDTPANFLEQFKVDDDLAPCEVHGEDPDENCPVCREWVQAMDRRAAMEEAKHNDELTFTGCIVAPWVPGTDCFAGARGALPASWEKPVCLECGKIDGPAGGGRYGFDDDAGKFFCGHCWGAWDEEEQEKIMKPAYMQGAGFDASPPSPRPDAGGASSSSAAATGNYFDDFAGAHSEGVDDVEGAWEPGRKDAGHGEQALPASWEKPICIECGKDDDEFGGGRYKRGAEGDKFYCGRCWKSWNVEARQNMMMAYAPSRCDPVCPPPDAHVNVMAMCPVPDAPRCDDLDWSAALGDREDRAWEGGDDEDLGPDDEHEKGASASGGAPPSTPPLPAAEGEAASQWGKRPWGWGSGGGSEVRWDDVKGGDEQAQQLAQGSGYGGASRSNAGGGSSSSWSAAGGYPSAAATSASPAGSFAEAPATAGAGESVSVAGVSSGTVGYGSAAGWSAYGGFGSWSGSGVPGAAWGAEGAAKSWSSGGSGGAWSGHGTGGYSGGAWCTDDRAIDAGNVVADAGAGGTGTPVTADASS